MLKFIIRLDDACPYMNEENWIRMEQLSDKYNIKPIVGVIPDYKGVNLNKLTIFGKNIHSSGKIKDE